MSLKIKVIVFPPQPKIPTRIIKVIGFRFTLLPQLERKFHTILGSEEPLKNDPQSLPRFKKIKF